ncbi:hypothetical protein [Legionella sp.]|uniref:hypothetical protein n=1 Tax=Legionella sp. TaxID=459 RepID=UPI003C9E001C
MSKTKYIPPKKTFDQIEAQWNAIQTLDTKNKFKAMREIGNDLLNSYNKKEIEIEQMEFYIKILKPIVRAYSYPQKCSKLLSTITGDWLELSGYDNAKIISTAKSKYISDCPNICIGDLSCFKENQNVSPDLLSSYSYRLSLMNEGKLYELRTGGDAGFYLELRLIDALEPVLTSKELKYVLDTTETAVMHLPTGNISVGYHSTADEKLHLLSLPVTPGNYKMSTFFIYKKRVVIFCIVLCKTHAVAKNSYQSIYSFSEDY